MIEGGDVYEVYEEESCYSDGLKMNRFTDKLDESLGKLKLITGDILVVTFPKKDPPSPAATLSISPDRSSISDAAGDSAMDTETNAGGQQGIISNPNVGGGDEGEEEKEKKVSTGETNVDLTPHKRAREGDTLAGPNTTSTAIVPTPSPSSAVSPSVSNDEAKPMTGSHEPPVVKKPKGKLLVMGGGTPRQRYSNNFFSSSHDGDDNEVNVSFQKRFIPKFEDVTSYYDYHRQITRVQFTDVCSPDNTPLPLHLRSLLLNASKSETIGTIRKNLSVCTQWPASKIRVYSDRAGLHGSLTIGMGKTDLSDSTLLKEALRQHGSLFFQPVFHDRVVGEVDCLRRAHVEWEGEMLSLDVAGLEKDGVENIGNVVASMLYTAYCVSCVRKEREEGKKDVTASVPVLSDEDLSSLVSNYYLCVTNKHSVVDLIFEETQIEVLRSHLSQSYQTHLYAFPRPPMEDGKKYIAVCFSDISRAYRLKNYIDPVHIIVPIGTTYGKVRELLQAKVKPALRTAVQDKWRFTVGLIVKEDDDIVHEVVDSDTDNEEMSHGRRSRPSSPSAINVHSATVLSSLGKPIFLSPLTSQRLSTQNILVSLPPEDVEMGGGEEVEAVPSCLNGAMKTSSLTTDIPPPAPETQGIARLDVSVIYCSHGRHQEIDIKMMSA